MKYLLFTVLTATLLFSACTQTPITEIETPVETIVEIEAPEPVLAPKPEPEVTITENTIKLSSVKPGDQLGALTVTKVSAANPTHEYFDWNARIQFAGEVTLTGTYEDVDTEMFGGMICMTSLDAESQAKMPMLPGDKRRYLFCFPDLDHARSLLGSQPGDAGTVTLTIKDYTYLRIETEQTSVATLVEVL
jgi:hypothetical protein